jgi:hypothetical protein
MKKSTNGTLDLTAGILFAITSALNFIDSKNAAGFIYLCLATVFILLGYNLKKKK